jgi:hypothetical protein
MDVLASSPLDSLKGCFDRMGIDEDKYWCDLREGPVENDLLRAGDTVHRYDKNPTEILVWIYDCPAINYAFISRINPVESLKQVLAHCNMDEGGYRLLINNIDCSNELLSDECKIWYIPLYRRFPPSNRHDYTKVVVTNCPLLPQVILPKVNPWDALQVELTIRKVIPESYICTVRHEPCTNQNVSNCEIIHFNPISRIRPSEADRDNPAEIQVCVKHCPALEKAILSARKPLDALTALLLDQGLELLLFACTVNSKPCTNDNIFDNCTIDFSWNYRAVYRLSGY